MVLDLLFCLFFSVCSCIVCSTSDLWLLLTLWYLETFFYTQDHYTWLFRTIVVIWNMQFDLQLPVQSVPITTKVVSLDPAHGKVYLIQHYVIKFDSDLMQVGGFIHQVTFNNISVIWCQFYWRRNQRKSPTCCKSLTNFIT